MSRNAQGWPLKYFRKEVVKLFDKQVHFHSPLFPVGRYIILFTGNKKKTPKYSKFVLKIFGSLEGVTRQCFTKDGRGFVGKVNLTWKGHSCVRWDEVHNLTFTTNTFFEYSLKEVENYCRNPDRPNRKKPWCYTSVDKHWDYCAVLNCRRDCVSETEEEIFHGKISKTKSGQTCQKWSEDKPHKHHFKLHAQFPDRHNNHNYCRNPLSSQTRPWCFTTNSSLRYEACDIPSCPTHFDVFSASVDNATSLGQFENQISCWFWGDGLTVNQWRLSHIHKHCSSRSVVVVACVALNGGEFNWKYIILDCKSISTTTSTAIPLTSKSTSTTLETTSSVEITVPETTMTTTKIVDSSTEIVDMKTSAEETTTTTDESTTAEQAKTTTAFKTLTTTTALESTLTTVDESTAIAANETTTTTFEEPTTTTTDETTTATDEGTTTTTTDETTTATAEGTSTATIDETTTATGEETTTTTTDDTTTATVDETTTTTVDETTTTTDETTTTTVDETTTTTAERTTITSVDETTTTTAERTTTITVDETTTNAADKLTKPTTADSTVSENGSTTPLTDESTTTITDESTTTITDESITTITDESSTTITDELTTVTSEEPTTTTTIRGTRATTINESTTSIAANNTKRGETTTAREATVGRSSEITDAPYLRASTTLLSSTTATTTPDHIRDSCLSRSQMVNSDTVTVCNCKHESLSYDLDRMRQQAYLSTRHLILNKRNLTKYKRQLCSVPDKRPVSVSIGTSSLILLVFVAAFIIITDFMRFVRWTSGKDAFRHLGKRSKFNRR